MYKKHPKVVIEDGGVVATVTCPCGNSFQVKIWGVVYKRDKNGKVLGQVETNQNIKKCKCGKKYIFICIPDIAYKILE